MSLLHRKYVSDWRCLRINNWFFTCWCKMGSNEPSTLMQGKGRYEWNTRLSRSLGVLDYVWLAMTPLNMSWQLTVEVNCVLEMEMGVFSILSSWKGIRHYNVETTPFCCCWGELQATVEYSGTMKLSWVLKYSKAKVHTGHWSTLWPLGTLESRCTLRH